MTDLAGEIAGFRSFVEINPDLYQDLDRRRPVILVDDDGIRTVLESIDDPDSGAGGRPSPPRIGPVYQDEYITVVRDPVEFADGSRGTYVRVVNGSDVADGAAIIPAYRGRLLVLAHDRHATGATHLEVPRGHGHQGETGTQTARRELLEEIGATIGRIVPLGTYHPDTGLVSQRIGLYWADVISWTKPNRRESIRDVKALDPQEMERLIREDEITDGFTLAAFLRARLAGLL